MPNAHRFIDPCDFADALSIMVQVWVEKDTHPTALNWIRTHCGPKRIRRPKTGDGHTIMHLPQVQVAIPSLESDLEGQGFFLARAYGALREDKNGITIENKGAITLVFAREDDDADPIDLFDPELAGVNSLLGELTESTRPLSFNAAYAWSNPNGVVTIQLDGADQAAPVPGLVSLRVDDNGLWLKQTREVTVTEGVLTAQLLAKPVGITPTEAYELAQLVLRSSAA